MSIFGFLEDFGTYEQRQVARYEHEILIVCTARVSDGVKPIETAVSHAEYNDGKWVIMESYDTEDQALVGHQKWVDTMTAESLPDILVDCRNSLISQLMPADALMFPRSKGVPDELHRRNG